jgi:hypothetical protein
MKRMFGYSLQGWPQWNELIPYPPRDESTNAMWGLPIFHPRLHLAVGAGILFVGAGRYLYGYCTSGERLWTATLSTAETSAPCTFSTDLPTRQDRLLRLGLGTDQEQVRTGYLRLTHDTLLDSGWLKTEVSDMEPEEAGVNLVAVAVGEAPFTLGISTLRAAESGAAIGTQDGLVHRFDSEGILRATYRVGEASVEEVLVSASELKAAYCAGRLTQFAKGRVSSTTELPEYFVNLAECGNEVLAWKSNALWLVETSGRVQLAAESVRPIRGVWGHGTGFYVLTGELASFQTAPELRSSAHS